jgi:RecA/RadA recombinase
MARPKKSEEIQPIVIATEKDLDNAFKAMDKINSDATYLSDSPLSEVKDWIPTGCYALNAIISGSVYKGVPSGRVTGFYGLQSSGKTMIVNKIAANAQKMGYKHVAYFDSENALDAMVAERLGGDITKIKHLPVELIEDCKNQCIKLLTGLMEIGAKRKAVIIIDSLGNLSTRKELNDALEGSDASDMGLRAKSLSSLIRLLTYRAAKVEAPVLFTNHVYENPGQLHPGMIKKQSGGLKPLFIASVLVQLSVSANKVEDNKNAATSVIGDRINGVTLTALTAKNRFVPPFIAAENIQLNFKTGLSMYMGLLDLAEKYGMITKEGTRYIYKNEIIGFRSQFEDKGEFWENGPLQELDGLIQKDLTYSNEKYKDLKAEVDAIDVDFETEENKEQHV